MRKLLLLLITAALCNLGPPPASADDVPPGRLVREVAAAGTPHVLDGRVYSVTRVGSTIILGGTFSRARNDDSQTELSRLRLLAFDQGTGKISTSFVPNPNGTVRVVTPAGDGTSVYVGGSFSSIGGVARDGLARIRVSDGAVLPGFDAGNITGQVRDLALRDGRLWVAGVFTHIGGRAQTALATVDPGTGADTDYMTLPIAGNHNDGNTQVLKLDLSPDGDRLVAVGNFDTLDGSVSHQMLVLDTSGASAQPADFVTRFYETPCSQSFDTYMRDVDFSPDGEFFVVNTTGAYGGSTVACDSSARFETDSTGTDVTPSWVDHTGGDTLYAVEVTEHAVYVGGHQRWHNNSFAGDRPGPGAVPREGIAALDPLNGLPMSWNPGRTRGVGAFDLMYTAQGLWVASDTDRIGEWQYKGRIALLPADGSDFPGVRTPTLPNDIFAGGVAGSVPDPSVVHRVNAGGPALAAGVGPDWQADTSGSPSPFHNHVSNRATWGAVPAVDSTVPPGTPSAIFDAELWDPGSLPEQRWDFPVEDGAPLKVRLYFASRCSCTNDPGERVFNVDLDGVRVLNNFDIVAVAGHNRGTMREFSITSDGNVDIDLGHLVENPLINGIEIVRTDVPGPEPGSLSRRSYDPAGDVGDVQEAPDGGLDWNSVRGAFMLNGWMYIAHDDGRFTRRTFDGVTYGAPVAVDTADQLVPLASWQSDIQAATGMFYDSGRIYFIRAGSDQLFYRYFTAESDVVGARRLTASGSVPGIDFAQVRGMFGTGDELWWATPDGNLRRIDWAQGGPSGAPVAGTATVASGPDVDGNTWGAKALFLYQDEDGNGVGMPPTAAFDETCSGSTCTFDGGDSTAPGSSIVDYAWDFGDGHTGTGVGPEHTYAASGTYQVTLTVTTDSGAVDSVTHPVSVVRVNQEPDASFNVSCLELTCEVDASASSDPDGEIAGWSWDFGDGATGSGETASHTYDSPGPRTIELTVTDDEGATDVVTQEVDPSLAAVEFVAARNANRNAVNHQVAVPDAVQAGDTLVLNTAVNSTNVTVDGPDGWTLLEQLDGPGVQGRLWTRTATTADAGSEVSVALSGYAKVDLSLAAYRATGGESTSVVGHGATLQQTSETDHTSPTVAAPGGAWVNTYWAAKGSSDITWTTPPSEVVRTAADGAGGGRIASVMVDSGEALPSGPAGGLTATTSPEVTRSIAFTTVVGMG